MKTILKMKWNEATEQWRMLTLDDRVLQEIYDCENVYRYFEGLDKNHSCLYEVEIKKR